MNQKIRNDLVVLEYMLFPLSVFILKLIFRFNCNANNDNGMVCYYDYKNGPSLSKIY